MPGVIVKSKLTPTFGYNVKAGRYTNLATGRFVKAEQVRVALDTALQRSQDEIRYLSRGLQAGRLSIADWQVAVGKEIRNAHRASAALAKGGWAQMRPEDNGAVGRKVKEELGYLARFGQQIEAGEVNLDNAGFLSRANMYGEAARGTYHAFETAAMSERGKTEVKSVLGVAEHCFIAGTMIETVSGPQAIETLQVGDYVLTRYGNRRIVRVYKHDTLSQLYRVTAGTRQVIATGNHPFLTRRGWVRADCLRSEDAVFIEDGTNGLKAHVAFPYALDSIAARGQISDARTITSMLLNLSFIQWFKARMSMPPIAVGLDNQIADNHVNHEVGLDDNVMLIDNAETIKDGTQPVFKFGRMLFLNTRMTLYHLSNHIGPAARAFGHSFTSAGQVGRIMFAHIRGRRVMNKGARRLFRKTQVEAVGPVSNALVWSAQSFGTPQRAMRRVVFSQKRNVVIRPGRDIPAPLVARPAVLRRKVFGVAALADVAAPGRFVLPLTRLADAGLPTVAHSTALRTDDFDTVAHELPPHSVPLYPIIQHSATVYNLGVEGAHEYIANGFVVHNCDECVSEAARDWVPIGEEVPIGERQCLTHCHCSLEYR